MRALTFFFDYAEVLCRAPSSRDQAQLARTAGWETSAFLDRYWLYRGAYDLGGTAAEYWTAVTGLDMASPSRADQLAALVAQDVAAWTHLDHGSIEVVARLREQSMGLIVLSNLPVELAAVVQSSALGTLFDTMLFSSDIGLAKPNPAIFRYALSRSDVPAQAAVLIDDRPANLISAAGVGMHTVPFENAYRLREQVSRWMSPRLGPGRAMARPASHMAW